MCAQEGKVRLKLDLAERCLRILIETQEAEVEAAQSTAEAILHCLNERHIQSPRLLHGDSAPTVWSMIEIALRHSYDTRIGFEDTLTLPNGQMARDNAELVSSHFVKQSK